MPTSVLADDSSLNLNIESELIKILYQQVYTAILTVLVTAIGVTVIYYDEFSDFRVLIWFSIVIVLSVTRYIAAKKYEVRERQAADVIRWGWVFAFFAFLSGLTWGGASIAFYTPNNLQLFNILTLMIIIISVGSMVALSAFPAAFYLYVYTAMLPMAWIYLNINEQSYVVFGVLLLIYIFALYKLVRVNHMKLRESIFLRFENINLIEQLTEQKEKAESASVSKTKFLAAASHDLRQPLHAMGLFLGALEDRVDNDEQKNIVHKIQKSSDALNGLLDSLLDISKLDAGVVQAVNEPFCINDLFDSLKNEFIVSAGEKGLTVEFVNTKFVIDSDYRMIERITRNLIANAINYTERGGVVVGCRRYNGNILLAVYDTGIGIDEDNIDDVFREFHQLHNPERDRSKGLGLGLSIVKRMTELLGLSLFVKSVVGKGSVFGVIIPDHSDGKIGLLKNDLAPDIKFFDGMNALVVDDETEVLDSISELLKSWHCNVISAVSGTDSVEKLKNTSFRPDIILSDYRLRDNETGMDVINIVNALHSGLAIPSVIITGDTAPERIKEAEASGTKVLHKPVSPNEIRTILAEHFQNK